MHTVLSYVTWIAVTLLGNVIHLAGNRANYACMFVEAELCSLLKYKEVYCKIYTALCGYIHCSRQLSQCLINLDHFALVWTPFVAVITVQNLRLLQSVDSEEDPGLNYA